MGSAKGQRATTGKNGLGEKTIFIFDAEEGMRLSKDVIHPDGHLIAPEGTILNMDTIAKISGYHILEINIFNQPTGTDSEDVPSEPTYYDKIRDSKEFNQFNETYNDNISEVKNELNDIIIHDGSINPTILLKNTNKILSTNKNSLQLLDMLHSLRNLEDITFVHSINVALICSIIGKWLKYSDDEIQLLTLSGILHDVGKILIPKQILTKQGKLTENEYEIMKKHVNLGYDKLKDKDIDEQVKQACLFHHERCDGSGYPLGLEGSKIPAIAKIVAIADVYDAMTSARIYREPFCPFEVIRLMELDAYTKFDPEFILPFLRNIVSSYIHNNVRLSDGRIGEVVFMNENALSRPIVLCNNDFIDLSKQKDLTIKAIL
jgi:HD-GYP domain-containing protein (c-di-GMP phosphodiesterase class II)